MKTTDKNMAYIKQLLKQDTLSAEEVTSLLDIVQVNILDLLDSDECYCLENILVAHWNIHTARPDLATIHTKEKIDQIIKRLQGE